MGKYQLDYKSQAQVERYHEKNSVSNKNGHKTRVQELLRRANIGKND
ncbi:hypothetical protein ACVR0S_01735 [Streptococcus dentapri]|uniref:30S ribosomal protein S10 n=1 Tax=Streptococcus dentapri TaxID=573564 RepID=A0ABV8D247_9STRE